MLDKRDDKDISEQNDEGNREDPFKKGIIYDAETFQQKVASGELTDDKGTAFILINGSPTNYNVHIDRRCVTRSDGSLITHAGFLKMYSLEEISVRFVKKEKKFKSIRQLKQEREERNNKSSQLSRQSHY